MILKDVLSGRWLDRKLNRLTGLPGMATIEPTTRCNCRCVNCRSLLSKTGEDFGRGHDMTLEQFDTLLDRLPFIGRLEFLGLGEPLLHPYLFEMISKAKRRGKRTLVGTNGTLLDESTCEKVVQSGLIKLRVSVDSVDPDTFARLREGAELEEVKVGIRTLVETKRRMKSEYPKLILSVVATRENQGELKDLVDLAHALEVPQVRIRNLYAPLPEMLERKIPDLENLQMIPELTEYGRKLGIEVHTFTEECLKDLRGIYINVDGYVAPCIFAYYPGKIQFGNIFENSLDNIWNSPEYIEMRETIASGTAEFCRLCKGLASDAGD